MFWLNLRDKIKFSRKVFIKLFFFQSGYKYSVVNYVTNCVIHPLLALYIETCFGQISESKFDWNIKGKFKGHPLQVIVRL